MAPNICCYLNTCH